MDRKGFFENDAEAMYSSFDLDNKAATISQFS